MSSVIRVLLVEDHVVLREALERVLDRDGFEVVASVATPAEAERALQAQQVDVAVVDLGLGRNDGLDLLQQIKDLQSTCRTVVYTGAPPSDRFLKAIDLGALGLVSKLGPVGELVAAIESAHRGELFVDNEFSEALGLESPHDRS